MDRKVTRRDMLRGQLGVGVIALASVVPARPEPAKPVRIGMVGVGARGTHLLNVLLHFENVQINAIADITPPNLAHAQDMVEQSRGKRPAGYGAGPEDFKNLAARDDLDAVIAATPPEWHAPVGVAAMKAKKYAGVEVPAAVTLEQCWDLVNTSEATGMPCMMLENVCYFRDTMMVLNMVRQGVFGELTHCAAGYQHDCRYQCFDEKGEFGSSKFALVGGPSSYQLWYTRYCADHNGNLYPTHPIGPMAQYLNINRGDRFSYLVSMSSKSRGLNRYVKNKFGANHPNARRRYAQGDVNTTLIRTESGCTITLYYDTQSPRPYDLMFRVQGTRGLYMMRGDAIYVEGEGKADEWDNIERYREKYEHPLWRQLAAAAEGQGHGGADYVTLYRFLQAVQERTKPDLDVYDAATWSVITPLSETSVNQGSAPVKFPDFTRGKWNSGSAA